MPSRTKDRSFFLVDRNYIAADSIRYLLESEGHAVSGICTHAAETLRRLSAAPPTVLVVGSELSDITGLELVRATGRLHPAMRRILFMREAEAEYAKTALDEGVDGLLSPDIPVSVLLECAAAVAAGSSYIHAAHRDNIVRRLGPHALLSDRERQVFDLIGKGLTSLQTGDRLYVSKNTIDRHRANMARKLGLSGANALAQYALRHTPGER